METKHSDPAITSLPLTVENLERKREELSQGADGGASTPKPYHLLDPATANNSTAGVPAEFALVGKFKTAVNEVLTCLGAAGNTYDLDDFIAVADECLLGLKRLKVERRFEARRGNATLQRTANSSAGMVPAYPPASPTACDENEERSGTPGPTSYMAALLKKRTSPKRSPTKTDAARRDDVDASRQASVLRTEERQRLAEERRLDRLQEMRLKSEAAEAREQQVKARREEAEMRQRATAEDRLESNRRRAEEARRHTAERGMRSNWRSDEGRLSSDARYPLRSAPQDRRSVDPEPSPEEQKRQGHEPKQPKTDEAEKKADENAPAAAPASEEPRENRRTKQEVQDQKAREALEAMEAKARRDAEVESKPTLQEFMPPMTTQEEEQMAQRTAKLVAASARQGNAFVDNYQKESRGSPKDLNRSKLRPAFSRLSTAVGVPAPVQCKQPLNDVLSSALTETDFEFLRYFNQYDLIVKVIGEARKTRELGVVHQATNLLLLLFVDEAEGKSNVVYFVRSGCAVPLVLCIREEMKVARQYNNNDALRWMLSVVGVCLERLSKESAQSQAAQVREQLLNDVDTLGLDRVCLGVMRTKPEETDLELVYCALCILNIELSVFSKRKNDLRPSWFQTTAASFFALLRDILAPCGVPVSMAGSPPLSCGRVTVLFCVFRTLNMLARWQLAAFQALLHDADAKKKAALITRASVAGVPVVALSTGQPVEENGSAEAAKNGAGVASASVQLTRQELFHVLNTFFLYIHDHTDELEAIPYVPTGEATPPALSSDGAAGPGTSVTSLSFSGGSASAFYTFEDAAKYGLTLPSIPSYPVVDSTGATREAFHPGGRNYPLRAALHECLLLIGYLCLDDSALQEMMGWGEKRTLLGNILNVLPAQYFTNAQHVLFPTVLAAINDNIRNAQVAMAEMEPHLLHRFITTEFNALSRGAKAYAEEHNKQLTQYKIETDPKEAIRHSMTKMASRNWADMVDDDALLEVHTSHSTDTTSTTPALEKEKLCKLFRVPGTAAQSYPGFYKIDRRFPITYWPAVIEQLEIILDNKQRGKQ